MPSRSSPRSPSSRSSTTTTTTNNSSSSSSKNTGTRSRASHLSPASSDLFAGKPSSPSPSPSRKSHRRKQSSWSAALISSTSSSPSVPWRRGPDLESSSSTMASSQAKAAQGAGKRAPSGRFWQKNYLVAYNLASAVLWATVLGRVALWVPLVGTRHVYGGVGEYAKWVQTGALLEVLHSLIGLVRAPLLTTVMQVASRILLVWGVVDRYPDDTSPSTFYTTMLLAWSVTEVIRYGFFVMSLKGSGPAGVPRFLTWLRYNTFFVLYPLGITSEVMMVWKASGVAGGLEKLVLWAILAIYVPGSYVLYTHMMKQRRKVLREAADNARRGRVDSVKGAEFTK